MHATTLCTTGKWTSDPWVLRWTPSLPRVINVKFPLQPHKKQHYTVWRAWLFIAYSVDRLLTTNSHYITYMHLSLKGWENVLYELVSERVAFATLLLCVHATFLLSCFCAIVPPTCSELLSILFRMAGSLIAFVLAVFLTILLLTPPSF